MHGCDILFTPVVAGQVKAAVRQHMGGTCPCEDDRTCPLLPEDLTVILPMPKLRAS